DGGVDARPEAAIGAVPADRDGVTLGQHLVLGRLVQDELPVGEVREETWPVVVEHLAVEVVLRPDLDRQIGDAVPQFRPLAVTHNLGTHSVAQPFRPAPVILAPMASPSATSPLIGRTMMVSASMRPSALVWTKSRPSSWRSPTRARKISATRSPSATSSM